LADWTFTQRWIHLSLPNKSVISSQGKHVSTETGSDIVHSGREHTTMRQEKLPELAGIHRQWLGRWERGRTLPLPADWAKLRSILKFPAHVDR